MKHLRDEIGLAQNLLALYLKQPRYQLAKYEAGTRPLAMEAIKKLIPLLKILKEGVFTGRTEAAEKKLKEINTVEKNILEANRNDFDYDALTLERKLEQVKIKYDTNLKMLHMAKCMLELCTESEEGIRDKELIKIMENNALRKIKENNRAVQLMMEIKIELYKSICKRLKEEEPNWEEHI